MAISEKWSPDTTVILYKFSLIFSIAKYTRTGLQRTPGNTGMNLNQTNIHTRDIRYNLLWEFKIFGFHAASVISIFHHA